ncbi:uncharacterized protein LOC131952790 [Physella acuta]|uniref:uncharacterized protein LOC131952790 n=1 Tax=Physella acuta TaxID=109671 RepID=UPI0027DB5576|nr:uncharacterized protein LOC131952790 [Physella acuta]
MDDPPKFNKNERKSMDKFLFSMKAASGPASERNSNDATTRRSNDATTRRSNDATARRSTDASSRRSSTEKLTAKKLIGSSGTSVSSLDTNDDFAQNAKPSTKKSVSLLRLRQSMQRLSVSSQDSNSTPKSSSSSKSKKSSASSRSAKLSSAEMLSEKKAIFIRIHGIVMNVSGDFELLAHVPAEPKIELIKEPVLEEGATSGVHKIRKRTSFAQVVDQYLDLNIHDPKELKPKTSLEEEVELMEKHDFEEEKKPLTSRRKSKFGPTEKTESHKNSHLWSDVGMQLVNSKKKPSLFELLVNESRTVSSEHLTLHERKKPMFATPSASSEDTTKKKAGKNTDKDNTSRKVTDKTSDTDNESQMQPKKLPAIPSSDYDGSAPGNKSTDEEEEFYDLVDNGQDFPQKYQGRTFGSSDEEFFDAIDGSVETSTIKSVLATSKQDKSTKNQQKGSKGIKWVDDESFVSLQDDEEDEWHDIN